MKEVNSHKKKAKDIVLDLIESFISSFVLLALLYLFLAFPEIVSGASMEPLLQDGERILVERVTIKTKGVDRGDVIVFHPPGNDAIDYVKRVVGMPGDIVKIEDCRVFITRDNKKFVLEEPYLSKDACTKGGKGFVEGKAQKIDDDKYLSYSEKKILDGIKNNEKLLKQILEKLNNPTNKGESK